MKGPTGAAAANDNYGVHVENNFEALGDEEDPLEYMEKVNAQKTKDKVVSLSISFCNSNHFHANADLKFVEVAQSLRDWIAYIG